MAVQKDNLLQARKCRRNKVPREVGLSNEETEEKIRNRTKINIIQPMKLVAIIFL